MRRLAFALCLLCPTVACYQPALLEVNDAWARDTVGGTANAAVYMTITSPTADRLVSASAAVAGQTDLMTMAGGSDAMGMEYVEAIDIPADEPVSLNPRGLHVWLDDLDRPLRAGQTFPLVVTFEKAGRRRVVVSVIGPAAAPPMPGMAM